METVTVNLAKEGERCGTCGSEDNKAYLNCKVEGCALLDGKKLYTVFVAQKNNVTIRFRHDELTHKGTMKMHEGDRIILNEKDFMVLPTKTERPFG